jgi:phosphatidylglycerophosphate synthase
LGAADLRSRASTRRPIATRNQRWAQRIAARLARSAITPNAISVASALFGCAGGGALWQASRVGPNWASGLYITAALCIQGRLLCNLFDGMVAVEGGKKTPAGEIYNELPDRISDSALLLGAGLGTAHPWGLPLGLGAALLAMATAYVRLLGVSAGTPHFFLGPMAKQHRMALLSAACLVAAVACHMGGAATVLMGALLLIAVGSLWTALRRTARIVRQLEDHDE